MSSSELKRLAKDQINGNILMLFVISLLIGLISSIGGSIVGTVTFGLGTIFVPALLAPFTIATIRIYQKMASTGESPAIGDIFSGFNVFGKAFCATLLQTIYLALWSILFIPIFIKPYSYCLTSYIIADNPDIGANEAITKSRQMMNGHKLERFWLDLTFIGWWFLVFITGGLAAIYVGPYYNATLLNFYNYCKAEYSAYNEPAPGMYDTWAAPVSEPVWNAPSSEPVWNTPASEPVWNAPDAEPQRTTLQPPKSL